MQRCLLDEMRQKVLRRNSIFNASLYFAKTVSLGKSYYLKIYRRSSAGDFEALFIIPLSLTINLQG